MKLVPITIRAGQTFRGTQYLQPAEFDCSVEFAFFTVKDGKADWNAKRFAAFIAEDIKRDVRDDRALMKCKSFGELHDVCDANCLGGLCESDERCESSVEGQHHSGGCSCHPVWRIDPSTEEKSGGRMVGPIDVIADAQEIVHQWILRGHKDDGSEPRCECAQCGWRGARGSVKISIEQGPPLTKDPEVITETRIGMMCPKCSAPMDV